MSARVAAIEAEPTLLGLHFFAMRAAIEKLWGAPGLALFAEKLSHETRAATFDVPLFARTPVPTRYVLDWYAAVMAGPANGDLAAFDAFTRGLIDEGFGRVQRFMLRMISVQMLIDGAEKMWRAEHSVGRLRAARTSTGASFEFSEHPYTEDELGRISTAEILRYVCEIVAGKPTTSRFTHRPGVLSIDVSW